MFTTRRLGNHLLIVIKDSLALSVESGEFIVSGGCSTVRFRANSAHNKVGP